jgi:uncharacterized repeat protein (TIGR03803 family)
MRSSLLIVLFITLGLSAHFAQAQGSSPHLTTLYNFTFASDGAYPYGTMVVGKDGALYGLATGGAVDCGGEPNCGIIFELKPPASPNGAWTETTIYSFVSSALPGLSATGLLMGKNGEIYGTAATIAPSMNGAVFVLTPPSPGGAWTYTDIYSFMGGTDGAFPNGLAFGGKGELYGTTASGGPAQAGTVFKLTPPSSPSGAWTESVIYAFQGVPDGANPSAGVTIGRDGVVAGTTHFGGTGGCQGFIGTDTGCGTVFELAPPSSSNGLWTEKLLFSLNTVDNAGWYPDAGVVLGAGGSLFAITPAGGPTGKGSPFELTPPSSPADPWTETVLTTFAGPHSPGHVFSNLLGLANGVLLGTSAGGGASNNGLIFALVPPTSPQGSSWRDVPVYSFTGGNGGSVPNGGLVFGRNGALYGVTQNGGNSTACLNKGCGTVFELKF